VGALLRVGDPGRVGVSYRSKVKHTIEGDAAFDNAPTFATQGPLGPLGSALNARFAPGPVKADVDLPDTFSVAAAYLGPKVEVLADWTWTGWDSIQDLTILRDDDSPLSNVPLKFEDTWRVGGGFNYRLNDTWKLRLGVAYDKAPVQDAHRTPRLPDEDRTWVATGFEARIGKGALDVGYAHLFIKDATSDLPNQDDPRASAPAGNLVGDYAAAVNLLTVQYRISF
jgi:long-chain fatty acid transport protein